MQPFWFPSVYSDGRLVSCEQDFNATEQSGVITKERSFMELWKGDAAARVRSTVRDHPESYSFCRNCPAWDRETTDTSISAAFFDETLTRPFVARRGSRG